jgi:aminoglycoside 3-N-acetyltransferase
MTQFDGPLFIHTDIRRSISAARAGGIEITGDLKKSLLNYFARFVGGDHTRLIFPAFNYDYGKTRIFDVDNDPAQVGSIPEHIRVSGNYTRTDIPIFSFSSAANMNLDTTGIINPFGVKSGFQRLIDLDATIMFAGAKLASVTFIHFVEEMSGKPVYRYEKQFPGQIVKNGHSQACDFHMHVRPLGVHMDYDWPRLEADLNEAGIMHHAEYSDSMMWMSAKKLYAFWEDKITQDPLYLLDQPSLDHFKDATQNGTRRVQLEEYEGE